MKGHGQKETIFRDIKGFLLSRITRLQLKRAVLGPCRFTVCIVFIYDSTTDNSTLIQLANGCFRSFLLFVNPDIFSLHPSNVKESRPAVGPTQPPTQWVLWTLSPGVKQPRHEDDHSAPSSAEVKNTWSYTSNPRHVFMA
jgi:hypothetical protein